MKFTILSGQFIGVSTFDHCAAITTASSSPGPSSQAETSARSVKLDVLHAQCSWLVLLAHGLVLPYVPSISPGFFENIYLLSVNSYCFVHEFCFVDRCKAALSLRMGALLEALLCFPGSPSGLAGNSDQGDRCCPDLHLGFHGECWRMGGGRGALRVQTLVV